MESSISPANLNVESFKLCSCLSQTSLSSGILNPQIFYVNAFFFLMYIVDRFFFLSVFCILLAQTSCLISERMFVSTGNCFSSSTAATYYYCGWQTNDVVGVSQGCHCSHYGFCASYGGQGRYWYVISAFYSDHLTCCRTLTLLSKLGEIADLKKIMQ